LECGPFSAAKVSQPLSSDGGPDHFPEPHPSRTLAAVPSSLTAVTNQHFEMFTIKLGEKFIDVYPSWIHGK
jgi:hypothetical protein